MVAEPRPSTYDDDYWLVTEAPGRGTGEAPGKWMVFVYAADVDHYWALIRQAVLTGSLGPSAKVATAKPNPNATNPRARLICVYTADWRDRGDVRRVLRTLRGLGVSWRLSYKTDEATTSGQYGPGSSIYVSPPDSDDFDDRT
ncbi:MULTISPECIES: putative phosphothreonine lyase domain-containing protein [Amycolatopsis]|uniref:Phosphothreonine lyase domain-containing protein n=1 Tax=Amycolatopsis albidoflavus TaxID=102226 RepID=A0ABW5I8Z8_9PSEU